MKCKFCGRRTIQNTTGTPNAPCPERPGILGQHVYEAEAGR